MQPSRAGWAIWICLTALLAISGVYYPTRDVEQPPPEGGYPLESQTMAFAVRSALRSTWTTWSPVWAGSSPSIIVAVQYGTRRPERTRPCDCLQRQPWIGGDQHLGPPDEGPIGTIPRHDSNHTEESLRKTLRCGHTIKLRGRGQAGGRNPNNRRWPLRAIKRMFPKATGVGTWRDADLGRPVAAPLD
jgi:hypothetical protein